MTIYKIKEKKRTTGETRGRRRVVAYRIPVKTQGAKPFVVELRANEYTENDALVLAGIIGQIESAYNDGTKLDERRLEALDLFPDVKQRLIKKGFIALVKEKTLADVWEEYENATFDGLKPYSINHKKQSRRKFFQYFPADVPANALTKKDAQAFRNWLDVQINAGAIAETTAGGYISDAKRVFNWAVDVEIINKSPFDHIRKGTTTNPTRQFYLELDAVNKLILTCPTQEWRVLLLLARRLGLRIPSESSGLEWKNVDFETIVIYSPKTERHKHKGTRTAPLFPDVWEALRQLKDEQRRRGVSSPLVLPTLQRENLRTQFERIIARAGLEQWPKLFQNLRASAATDIRNNFGEQAEAAWVGHSPEIAKRHYLMVTPAAEAAAKEWNPRADHIDAPSIKPPTP